jgi:hypothetical protein
VQEVSLPLLEQLLVEWLLAQPCYLLFLLSVLPIGGTGNHKSIFSMYLASKLVFDYYLSRNIRETTFICSKQI